MNKQSTDSALELCFRVTLFSAMITLPVSTSICNVSLIAAFVLSVVLFIRTREFTTSLSLLPIVLFFLTVVSLLYSQNLKFAMARFELGASLIFIPLIFGFAGTRINSQLRQRLLLAFTFSCFAICVYGYVRMAILSGRLIPSTGMEEYRYEDTFSRQVFEEITNIHPSYLSVYLILVVVILFSALKTGDVLKGILVTVIFLFLVIMSAKNQIVIFFLVISVLLWNHINARRRIKVVILSGVIAAALVVGYFNSQVRFRFVNELSKTLGDRVILWKTGMEVISEHPLLGVGVGDTGDEMNKLLQKSDHLHLINYNLHNQYLDYWLMLGIPGILSLIVILVIPFFRKIDMTFVFLILIMGLSMLTESMLYRQKGLVFFLLFYGMFGVDYEIRRKRHESLEPGLSGN